MDKTVKPKSGVKKKIDSYYIKPHKTPKFPYVSSPSGKRVKHI